MHYCFFTIFLFILVNNSHEYFIKKPTEWDYIVFAQQWPPAVCQKQTSKECKIPANVTSWTVHGIWPTGKHDYPSFCNNTLTFNVSQIKSIESELLVVWPNLFPRTSTYKFWAHEWEKHGTCIISLSQLDNELKYFSMAIKLHSVYNMKILLENGGIIPDENKVYDIEDIHRVVDNQLGKRAGFECVKKSDNLSLLFNSYICLDKNLALIDCNNDRHCNDKKILYLPMKKDLFNITRLVFLKIPYNLGLSFVCYIISGLVLFLAMIIVAILLMCFVFERNKIQPPINEKVKSEKLQNIFYAIKS